MASICYVKQNYTVHDPMMEDVDLEDEAISFNPEPVENRSRAPSHRHASPSAPWPWIDLNDAVDREQLEKKMDPVPPLCDHLELCNDCWKGYPQSRFPNWTKSQVKKSKISHAIENGDMDTERPCTCYRVDVGVDGIFSDYECMVAKLGEEDERETWRRIIDDKRPGGLRVRALFIDNLSGPILQMLGAKYNIEPFFWSSSLNWIPSRFQEEVISGVGDHITTTLTFLRSMPCKKPGLYNQYTYNNTEEEIPSQMAFQINTGAPLILSHNRELVLDLLSVHLIRNVNGSTIISYHPNNNISNAEFLHERIRFAGQSVYWQNIFKRCADPTFLMLIFIWNAMYGWDEALEHLYQHICSLETLVIATRHTALTHELHVIRAHHLHYSSLLDDAAQHVEFIKNTPSPLLESLSKADRDFSSSIMRRECTSLLAEVKRLKVELLNQERRLKNVNGLVFASVNITDNRYMKKMTETAVRDSAAMKQIAYLTMVFLPASFVAGVFGMNVREINNSTRSIALYIAIAIPLTLATAWIIVAFQSKYIFADKKTFVKRLGWPVYVVTKRFKESTFFKAKLKAHKKTTTTLPMYNMRPSHRQRRVE